MPPTLLTTVQSAQEVLDQVETFNAFAPDHAERARSLLRQTTYWVRDLDTGRFGPSKFVGYAGLSLDYEQAVDRSRRAVEQAVGRSFEPGDDLVAEIVSWGEALLGPDAFGNADTATWRVLDLLGARNYWALLADPDRYRIDDAVRELEVDRWTVGRRRGAGWRPPRVLAGEGERARRPAGGGGAG